MTSRMPTVPGVMLALMGVFQITASFGTFMLTMFAMHDYKRPRWNQYPAMLAWIGVTWLVVALTDKSDSRFYQP